MITVGQLARSVSAAAGGRVSEGQFRQFWELAWWFFVKGWHATEFAILFLLLGRALPNRLVPVIAFSALFAVSDEFHQLFVPSRGCRASDVCIDWLGILAAWAVSSGWTRRSSRVQVWLAAACWLGLIYLLSVYPFGLVSLDHASSSVPRP